MRTPGDVVATALTHLARRNPGPSVIDGPLNRVSAAAARMMSRRSTAAVMHRVTDPVRRKRTKAEVSGS